MDYLELFTDLIACLEGYLCLAFKEDMKSDAAPVQSFFDWQAEEEKVIAWFEEHKSTNCYFCPHMLSEKSWKKVYALPGPTLYADLDGC